LQSIRYCNLSPLQLLVLLVLLRFCSKMQAAGQLLVP
jgi:hypothetical protein